jgi:transposase
MQGKKTEIRTDLHSPVALRALAKSEPVRRTAVRMLAIANALDGMSFTAAARAVGIERQALGDAAKRYNAEGIDGLSDRKKPGRRRKLDASQEKALAAIIVTGPDAETDGLSAYTLDDLCVIAAKRFDVAYCPTGMSRVIKRLGFSRQKARAHHPAKDEAAQGLFKGAA